MRAPFTARGRQLAVNRWSLEQASSYCNICQQWQSVVNGTDSVPYAA